MLRIVTDNGEFDLFGNETIVQTFSIFNLDDLTSRGGEYSNVFNLPLTNNNKKLIEYADFIPSINTTPYKKVSCILFIDDLEFKKAFLTIESIKDVIKARIFSGNSNFYDLVKRTYLSDLDWSGYDHVWNYTNAVASSANTSGYTYPLINYNGQTTSGNTMDVRKVLPATFNKSILDKIVSELGYTSVINFDDSYFNKSLIPYSKKNPTIDASIILLNQVDIGYSNNYTPIVNQFNTLLNNNIGALTAFESSAFSNNGGVTFAINDEIINNDFNLINTVDSSTFYNIGTKLYSPSYAGTYDYDFTIDLSNYDYLTWNFTPNVSDVDLHTNTRLVVTKISSGVRTILSTTICNTGVLTGAYGNPLPPFAQTFITNQATGSVYLEIGDTLEFRMLYKFFGTITGTSQPTLITVGVNPVIVDTSYLKVDLQTALVFGGLITYKSMLPKIKCNEFLKDIFIRFGILSVINEDTKVITFNYFDKVKENITSAIDWSDKIDESEFPDNSFAYDSYAQNNIIKHKEDKSIINGNINEDYNLLINNQNLELEKDLYISPFSQSENIDFNGTLTAYINLYDTNTSKFAKDVNYRILFSEPVVGLFKFTDGTSTSGFITVNRVWFIDESLPDLSMGFGMNLINKNSSTLINTLQNLRIVKANFNLNILDIYNLDYFIPVYIKKIQSYFFISSINQYNYTEHDLTEVELIKLN